MDFNANYQRQVRLKNIQPFHWRIGKIQEIHSRTWSAHVNFWQTHYFVNVLITTNSCLCLRNEKIEFWRVLVDLARETLRWAVLEAKKREKMEFLSDFAWQKSARCLWRERKMKTEFLSDFGWQTSAKVFVKWKKDFFGLRVTDVNQLFEKAKKEETWIFVCPRVTDVGQVFVKRKEEKNWIFGCFFALQTSTWCLWGERRVFRTKNGFAVAFVLPTRILWVWVDFVDFWERKMDFMSDQRRKKDWYFVADVWFYFNGFYDCSAEQKRWIFRCGRWVLFYGFLNCSAERRWWVFRCGCCVYFVDFILIMQRSKSNGYFVVEFIVLFLVVKNLLLNRLWKCHGYLFGFWCHWRHPAGDFDNCSRISGFSQIPSRRQQFFFLIQNSVH